MTTSTAAPVETTPSRVFSIATELRRQGSRPRTRIALACMVALPLIVLGAFEFGDDGGPGADNRGSGAFSSLVDVATSGGSNFALFTLLVSSSFLLVVVVALFFGDTIASEASWGSLRYLLAIPVPRARLLGVKLIVSLLYSALAMVLLVGTALLAGTARYGWNPLRSTIADEVSANEALRLVLGASGYIFITLLVVGAVAFLLSVSTDAPLGAVGGAVMLVIVSSILDQIDALGTLRNLLPTHFNDAWVGLLSTPIQWDTMVRGTISALLYGSVLSALAFWRFLRKDVVS